jgi:uroporphyrinogen-III decarboxylase
MEIVPDFVEIGFDCVCPFERPPGNVDGVEGIRAVRHMLQDKVTFNGNVHTVRALLQGTPETVRQQVRELKEAYKGSNRLIVGTGDQVAGGTPDENLWAMIEETRK